MTKQYKVPVSAPSVIVSGSIDVGGQLNLPSASSANDNDMWATTAGVFAHINGAVVGPFGSASGSYMDLSTNQSAAGNKTFTGASTTFSGDNTSTAASILYIAPTAASVNATLIALKKPATTGTFHYLDILGSAGNVLSWINANGKFFVIPPASNTAQINWQPNGASPTVGNLSAGDLWMNSGLSPARLQYTDTSQASGGVWTFATLEMSQLFTALTSLANASATVLSMGPSLAASAQIKLNVSGASPTNPGPGDLWATSSGLYYVSTSVNTAQRVITNVYSDSTASVTAGTAGTYVVPTGFASVTVLAGKSYHFTVVGAYQATATTASMNHRVRYPTLTRGMVQSSTFINTNITSGSANANLPTTSAVFTASTTQVANRPFGFVVEGTITPSASGTLVYDFSTSGTGSVAVLQGTFFKVEELR